MSDAWVLCAGGAVAGSVAASALVGIGAAALAGGAVLDAVNFPHSPQKVSAQQKSLPLHLPSYLVRYLEQFAGLFMIF